jgi:RNA polymerase sigma-70 factor (ECF subfamily)
MAQATADILRGRWEVGRDPTKPAPASSDGALVVSARDGSVDAFAVLVRRYTRLVFAVCLGILADVTECEDAVQEVFLKSLTRLDGLRENDRFGPWISQIARNHCLDLLRKNKRRREILGERPPAPIEQEHSHLHAALASLPEEYRLPLVLYYFDGHSTRNLAEILGLTEGGACTRLCRARKLLRQALGEGGANR